MLEVKFKVLRHGARPPVYAHPTDTGCDLRWHDRAAGGYGSTGV